jgi:transposase
MIQMDHFSISLWVRECSVLACSENARNIAGPLVTERNCPKRSDRLRTEASTIHETGPRSPILVLGANKMEASDAALAPFRTVSNTSLSALYAWAPKGERARCSVPRNRGPNMTLLASITVKGMGPCVTVEGVTTSVVFETYVEKVLAPTLRHGQVMVMDNLQVHKTERVRELIEVRGCELLYLPPYSPDFNPIEEAFSKIKTIVRKAEARTRVTLLEALGVAISAVSARDAQGFFEHCGYRTPVQPL